MGYRLLSLWLGGIIGLVAGYGAYESQYAAYIPHQADVDINSLLFSEKIEELPEESEEEDRINMKIDHIEYDEDIPMDVQESAQFYGDMYGICPELLEAIAFAESSYIPTAENGSCVGLMQINLDCEDQILRMESFGLSGEDMVEVDASMVVAASYLRELFEDYEDPAEVLIRYNGDRTGLRRYRESGEISAYAMKVLELSEKLERKHGK